MPMYLWASDMLEWETDLRDWSDDAQRDHMRVSPVADALVSRLVELEQLRHTSTENQRFQAMISDEELRRLADLDAIAETGSDNERMLHDLLTRYDKIRSRLELLYKKCNLMTSTGAKGGPRGWDVRRMELEELYLYLKEKLTTSGESFEEVAKELVKKIKRICNHGDHGAEIVELLLEIHLSEEELFTLKRHIDLVVNGMDQNQNVEAAEGKTHDEPLSGLDGKYESSSGIEFKISGDEVSPVLNEWTNEQYQSMNATLDSLVASFSSTKGDEDDSSKTFEEIGGGSFEHQRRHEEQIRACKFGLEMLLQHEQRTLQRRLNQGSDYEELTADEKSESKESAAKAIISRYESDHKRLIEELDRDRLNQRRRIEKRLKRGHVDIEDARVEDLALVDSAFSSYLEASRATHLQDCLTSLTATLSQAAPDNLRSEIENVVSAGQMLREELTQILRELRPDSEEHRPVDPEFELIPVTLVNQAYLKVASESSPRGSKGRQIYRIEPKDLMDRMRSVIVRSSWMDDDSQYGDAFRQIADKLAETSNMDNATGADERFSAMEQNQRRGNVIHDFVFLPYLICIYKGKRSFRKATAA